RLLRICHKLASSPHQSTAGKKTRENQMKTKQFLNLTAAAALLTGTIPIGSVSAQSANGPSDPQIVGIVLAADQIDIDYGKIALAKSKNKAIREFAQRMVTDHTAVQQSVIGLAA